MWQLCVQLMIKRFNIHNEIHVNGLQSVTWIWTTFLSTQNRLMRVVIKMSAKSHELCTNNGIQKHGEVKWDAITSESASVLRALSTHLESTLIWFLITTFTDTALYSGGPSSCSLLKIPCKQHNFWNKKVTARSSSHGTRQHKGRNTK